jgi:hypothetical protein
VAHVHQLFLSLPPDRMIQMRLKMIVYVTVLPVILLSIAGCGHVQTSSTENCVTVQDFGCPAGDKPCPYPPYCRP